jgi:hypothetical protein
MNRPESELAERIAGIESDSNITLTWIKISRSRPVGFSGPVDGPVDRKGRTISVEIQGKVGD